MNRILVAIDFTDVTDSLIAQAIIYCKALDGKMRVLHVENSAPYEFSPTDPNQPAKDVSESLDPDSNPVLQRIRDKLVREGISADFRCLDGPAGNNILLAAREFKADLIVIGGHHHGHLYEYFFGSSTDSIIRTAPCPVLVVPPKKAV